MSINNILRDTEGAAVDVGVNGVVEAAVGNNRNGIVGVTEINRK